MPVINQIVAREKHEVMLNVSLGLCYPFINEPISFRTAATKALSAMGRADQLHKLSGICRDHSRNLFLALEALQPLGIGALQIISPLCPRMTRPDVGCSLGDLPDINARFHHLGTVHGFTGRPAIRFNFHPDQFGG